MIALCLLAPVVSNGQTGTITTLAGTTPVDGAPERGFSGDGGPAISAMLALANVQNDCDPNRFEQTVHLSVDSNGNVFFADSNNQRIRKITSQGIISSVAGTGDRPTVDSLRCEPSGSVGDGGQAISAKFFNPADVLALPNGNLVIADQQDNRIRQVIPDGVISTIGGSGLHNLYAPGIPATASPMDWPSTVAVDAKGIVYFAEIHGFRVGKIGADGKFATVAGTGFPGYNGDGILATNAQLRKPAGICFDAAGNLYIADQQNHRIRKVASNGMISTVAGTGQAGFSGDGGPAQNAALNTPMDVKADSHGNIYIADMLNHRVRRIDAGGMISTVAGTGNQGRGPDGVIATSSSLNSPAGIALDSNDDLYIVDWQNYLIRKVSFDGRPAVATNGVVNAASFTPAAAPGSLISIFGSNLASSTASASSAPWPTKLGDTTVQVNGTNIPLYFVSPQQINAQLPFEVAAGTAILTVAAAAGSSDPAPLDLTPTSVGIFVVLNQDGSLNSPVNPEMRGRAIVAYLTGQGLVSPQVPTGQAAPLNVLSQATQNASATLGGVNFTPFFFGLAPGFVGLGQANVVIPPDAPTGDQVDFSITAGGQTSNVVKVSVQ